jgi:hypothetical protein
MEVTKRGHVNYPGDLIARGVVESAGITTNDLEVGKNAVVTNDLSVGGKAIINGDLIVTGKVINESIAEKCSEPLCNDEFKEGTVYLGDKSTEGTWRFRVEEGELLIEKFQNGDWEIKQSMS